METQTENKNLRSSRSPSVSLEYCLKIIQDARKFGKHISSTNIAGPGGSPKSGAFLRKKASLGYFGLISGSANDLQITDLSEKILFSVSEDEKSNALRESFLSPDLFKNIYDKLEKNTFIDLDLFGNVLIRDYGIQPSAKHRLITTFLSSGIFAGVVKISEDKKEFSLLSKNENQKPIVVGPEALTDIKSNMELKAEAPNTSYQAVDIDLSNGGKARIIVPKSKDLTKEDVKKLKVQIDVLSNFIDS